MHIRFSVILLPCNLCAIWQELLIGVNAHFQLLQAFATQLLSVGSTALQCGALLSLEGQLQRMVAAALQSSTPNSLANLLARLYRLQIEELQSALSRADRTCNAQQVKPPPLLHGRCADNSYTLKLSA